MNQIEITIYEVPGAKTVCVMDRDNGGTYVDALASVNIAIDGRSVTVNGVAPSENTPLENNDRITLARGAKGNS